MSRRWPKTITGPVQVERHDFDDGMIGYELWDVSGENYHRLCTIYEVDVKGAKAEAEFIALAINNALGALKAIDAAEAH